MTEEKTAIRSIANRFAENRICYSPASRAAALNFRFAINVGAVAPTRLFLARAGPSLQSGGRSKGMEDVAAAYTRGRYAFG
jgi:hypothetical protein